ncbi:MAG: leucine-rich repeat protein [Faecalibacterium sp.]|nr:leucine-rich repeat protein [Faecalibacterium sp.]
MKRILAVFLTLAMALNIAPVAAFAAADSDAASIVAVEETDENASSQLDEQTARAIASDPFLQAAYAQTEQEQASRAKVDTSDVSMEATDSFGRLLLAGMDEQQTNGTGDGTKKITGVTVSGNTATVEYVSDQIENLVVAIYTDDTEQEMVASGRMATNICQDGKARTDEVKLTGDIPSSFVVKAYLLDYYDYDPLCNAFVSNQYTSGMQELEDATISDFDEARTVNLDGDVTTNFAVVNEGVELLKPEGAAPDENRVAMQDDESLTYVIENADSRVLGLQPGDILVYPQDEGGMLIVKVKDISVSGTTATITGDEDIDLSEVFAVLKIEDSASTEDFEYEQGSAEGVTYAGMAAVPAALGMENGKEIDKDGSVGKELVVDKEFGSLKITGGVYATLGYGIKVMLDGEEKYISTHLDTGLTGTVTLTGKYNEAFEIGELSYTNPFIGLYAGIKPTIEVKADAYVEFTFKANKYNGFEYAFTGVDVKNGTVTDTSKPAECELYTEAKGSLYVGINLNPETYALWKVVDITMDARIGVTGDFKLLKADKEDPAKESLHTCDYCMTFNLTGSAELTIHLKVSLTVLFVSVKSQWDKQLFTTNWPIGEAYYSVVHDEFGWGACPYRTYRVKVAAGINGANAALSVTKGGSAVVSNKLDANGEYSMFLEPGSYTVKLAANNKEYTKTITVGGSAQTVEFKVKDNSDTGETVGSGKCGDNLTWKLDANGTLTISGTGDMYEYGSGLFGDAERVPWLSNLTSESPVQKLVLNEGITGISDFAFVGSKIETLDIPSSVTSIGSAAFSSCKDLVSVSGGENVSYLGSMAFLNCSSLASIDLSDKLEGLYMGTFKDCKSLTSITIPGNVAVYGLSDSVFSGCEKLKTVTLMYGVASIGGGTFKDCTALETITLPDTLTNIYSDAFENCTALTKVFYYGTEEDWNKITIAAGNDALTNATRSYIAEKHTSGSCGDSLTWTLNDAGVLTIQGTGGMTDYSQDFWNTDDVQKVIVKNGVTGIGAFAFYNCPNLTEVQLPSSLLEIGDSAFANCQKLTNVQLPANLTTLGSRAFWNDSGLLSINLPDALVSIGARAFENCRALQGSLTLPQGIVDVPPYLFHDCDKLESVQLASGTKSIGDNAFCLCSGLTAIKIPDSVTQIGDYAFDWCYNLKDVTLSKNLVSIGDSAFSGTAITSMDLPDSVTSIGTYAFEQTNLTGTFTIPSGVTEISAGLFKDCHNLKEVVIPDGITSIGAYAFYNTGITSFAIPDGITVVSMYTFYGADLESITIPSSVTAIGDNAFDCFGLKDVYYAGSQSEWSEIKIYSENEKLTEATIHYNYSSGGTFGGGGGGGRLSLDDDAPSVENSITTGTATEKSGTYYATFADAKAGKEYVVIVSKSKGLPLNADNLIYINQITADADGELTVPFRTAADAAEMTYVVACAQDDATDPTPADPDTPSSGGDGGGAIILIGGVAAVAAIAGVVMLMPVKVEGTVKLADQPVANATVQVLKDGSVAAQTTTDANGHFTVKVKRGGYTLRVQWTDANGQPVTRTVDFKAPNANLNVAA